MSICNLGVTHIKAFIPEENGDSFSGRGDTKRGKYEAFKLKLILMLSAAREGLYLIIEGIIET